MRPIVREEREKNVPRVYSLPVPLPGSASIVGVKIFSFVA
jgi:hypothetical protein